MATPAEYFPFFLDLEFFAHFHDEKGFRSGLIDYYGIAESFDFYIPSANTIILYLTDSDPQPKEFSVMHHFIPY